MSSTGIPEDFSTDNTDGVQPIPEISEKTDLDEPKVESTSSEPVLYFNENEKLKNLIITASEPAYNQPPPAYNQPPVYPYANDPGYRGHLGTTPVYQERNVYMVYPQQPQDASRTPRYQRPFTEDVLDAFDTVKIRNNFIRKVYMILSIQLSITFGFILLATYQKDVRIFVLYNTVCRILSSVVFMVLFMVLACYQYTRKTYPLNFILMALFTISGAYMAASTAVIYTPEIVLMAIGTTALVTVSISLLAWQIKFDITGCGMVLYIVGGIIMLYGIIAIFIVMFTDIRVVMLVYSCLVTLLFCLYLMYDTQQILGGRRIELSAEEYIYGALTLYVDILFIFINILNIFGYRS